MSDPPLYLEVLSLLFFSFLAACGGWLIHNHRYITGGMLFVLGFCGCMSTGTTVAFCDPLFWRALGADNPYRCNYDRQQSQNYNSPTASFHIKTPTVTRTVAQTIIETSRNGTRQSLGPSNWSIGMDRFEGTGGGVETRNRRELRVLNIYFLAWAIIFVFIVVWRIVIPIVGVGALFWAYITALTIRIIARIAGWIVSGICSTCFRPVVGAGDDWRHLDGRIAHPVVVRQLSR